MGHRARSASKAVTPLPHIPSRSHPYVAFLVCRIERCLCLRRNFVSVTSDIGPLETCRPARMSSAPGVRPERCGHAIRTMRMTRCGSGARATHSSRTKLPDLIEIVPPSRRTDATVVLPGSKSLTNRALILAALASNPVVLRGALWSEDTQAMVNLKRLGFCIEVADDPAEPANCILTVYGYCGRIPNAGTPAAHARVSSSRMPAQLRASCRRSCVSAKAPTAGSAAPLGGQRPGRRLRPR